MSLESVSPIRTLLASVLLAASISVLFPAGTVEAANAPEQLGSIEAIIVGSKNTKLSIEQRIKVLELKVYGKVQGGSLANRISSLGKFAGLADSSEASQMPAPAPPLKQVSEKPEASRDSVRDSKPGSNRVQSVAHKERSKPHSRSEKPTAERLEQAVKLHHDGRSQEAEVSLRKILDENPNNSDAYFSLGAIAESRGDLKTALDYYTTAMQSNPHDSEAQEAVADLSKRVAVQQNQQVFYNPLSPLPAPNPAEITAGTPFLQGRAWDLNANSNANASPDRYRGHAPLSVTLPQVPTASVSQNQPQRTFARTLARAALGAALNGSGLHCPVCHVLNGF